MRAARSIDKVRAAFHHAQFRFPDYMVYLGCVGEVQTQIVAVLQYGLKIHILRLLDHLRTPILGTWYFVPWSFNDLRPPILGTWYLVPWYFNRLPVVINHPHAACYRPPCERLTYSSHTDDTQSLTVQRLTQMAHHTKRYRVAKLIPVPGGIGQAFPYPAVELAYSPGYVNHQRKG